MRVSTSDRGRVAWTWAAAGPVCVACTVPWVWHATAAAGLVGAVTWAHYAGLAAAPVVAAAIVLGHRRRRRALPAVLALAALVPLAVHTALHLGTGANHHSVLFNVTDQAGITLLSLAVLASWWSPRPAPARLAPRTSR